MYYDRHALVSGATPARLGYPRIDVSRAHKGRGAFHPKLVLLLIAETEEDDDGNEEENCRESLIVGTLSANLTEPGWWRSVEAGHFEEAPDKAWAERPCPFRRDLLSLIRQIKASAAPGEDHAAIDRVHTFVADRLESPPNTRHWDANQFRTRLFSGQEALADWLAGMHLGTGWNLEIISPYFDKHCTAVLDDLWNVLKPSETRIYGTGSSRSRSHTRTGCYSSSSPGTRFSSPTSEHTKI